MVLQSYKILKANIKSANGNILAVGQNDLSTPILQRQFYSVNKKQFVLLNIANFLSRLSLILHVRIMLLIEIACRSTPEILVHEKKFSYFATTPSNDNRSIKEEVWAKTQNSGGDPTSLNRTKLIWLSLKELVFLSADKSAPIYIIMAL